MLTKARLGIVIALTIGACALAALAVNTGLALYTGQTSNTNNTLTSANCFPGNTGFLNPSAQAADTGGDGDGFEQNPTYAYADGSFYATNENGPGDRHRYYNYNVAMNSSCAIKGIEVRLDWWLSTTLGTNSMSVELSWNGGSSWTSAKVDTQESTSEHTAVLGSPTDTWGRTWTVNELSNANFRVRLTSNCSGDIFCYLRNFYLEWVPAKIYYGPS